MNLKIVQAGDPVLREVSRALTVAEIKSQPIQDLIVLMRDTMRDAPGVGLAAPQIGIPIQLAVIEDRIEYMNGISEAQLVEHDRAPVEFHVIINPRLTPVGDSAVEFFEGCLSVEGFGGLVRRWKSVRVEYLNERGEPVTVEAHGWYARILQHEIDHLNGTLYIDRMEPRSFTTTENLSRVWRHKTIAQVRTELGIAGDE
jgi:peptide deformylase